MKNTCLEIKETLMIDITDIFIRIAFTGIHRFYYLLFIQTLYNIFSYNKMCLCLINYFYLATKIYYRITNFEKIISPSSSAAASAAAARHANSSDSFFAITVFVSDSVSVSLSPWLSVQICHSFWRVHGASFNVHTKQKNVIFFFFFFLVHKHWGVHSKECTVHK